MDILGCHGGSASFEQWRNCCRKVWYILILLSSCTPTDILSATAPGQKVLISANRILTSRRNTWLISLNILKRSTVSLNLTLSSRWFDNVWMPIFSRGHTSWACSDSAPWNRQLGWWYVPSRWTGSWTQRCTRYWRNKSAHAQKKAASKAKVTQQDHHWRYAFSELSHGLA